MAEREREREIKTEGRREANGDLSADEQRRTETNQPKEGGKQALRGRKAREGENQKKELDRVCFSPSSSH